MRLIFIVPYIDPHVSRFDALFRSLTSNYLFLQVYGLKTLNPYIIVNKNRIYGWAKIKEELATEKTLVISGPLDLLSIDLSEGCFEHIALSFATDVMISAASNYKCLSDLKALLKTLSAVVIDNYATENALISMGLSSEKLIRIPWGPTESSFNSRKFSRKDFGLNKNAFVILYPRKLEPHYQPEVFIYALNKLVSEFPEISAIFIDSGSMASSIRGLISTLNIENNIHWLQPQLPADFQALIRTSDAVVVSPKTDGTSVTVLEAMSLGVPVVCSQTAGSAEWIMNGITGWTYPVGSVDGLASSISNLIGLNRSHIDSICENAKHLVSVRAGWNNSSKILTKKIDHFLFNF